MLGLINLTLQVDVFVGVSGLGEEVLPSLQRPPVLHPHLPARQISSLQASLHPDAPRSFAGERRVADIVSPRGLQLIKCLSVAGAPQRNHRRHRQRSDRSPSAGVRQEEAHSSEAADAQDCGSVSSNKRKLLGVL